jgi:hypothetical protein
MDTAEEACMTELPEWVDVWVPDSWCWKGASSPLAGKKIHMKINSDGEIQNCIVPNGSIIGIEKPELDAVKALWFGKNFPPWYKKESE